MTPAEEVASLTSPDELFDLFDPDVMWYSRDVNSNFTCNSKEDAVACVQRSLDTGITGRFDVVAQGPEYVVVQAITEPPRERDHALLMRFRDGLIVEMRDFASPAEAIRYAGMTLGAAVS